MKRLMQRKTALIFIYVLMVLWSCAQTREVAANDMNCPDSPNCVSSQASDPEYFVEPLKFSDDPSMAISRLKQSLLKEKRVTIVDEQADYLHAEIRSLIFRFVDDVEFRFSPEQKLIHLRSASRVGYSDFGVNRRRINRIREDFQQSN
jgi:uncharacterized protein (DUF1499 family)